jgi:hypothetical protein
LDGSGLVLQNNGGNNLTVTGTGTVNFTFTTGLIAGSAYAVTILTQPSNPVQTCTLANATGTIIGSVNNVLISCPQPKYPIGGTVVGLVIGSGDTLEIQDNAGDNLFVTGDVDFTFPTEFTFGSTYRVDLFLPPTSQSQGCNIFNSTALVTGIVSNVIVDCQHNDWAWMFPGTTAPTINTYGTASLPTYAAGTTVPVPPFASADPNTPGGRDFAMTWTDKLGNRWLFGGFGFEVTHTNTDGIPGYLNDMWVWPTTFPGNTGKDDGWASPGGWIPADLPIDIGIGPTYTADPTFLELKNLGPYYGTQGTGISCVNYTPTNPCTMPGSRWGGVTWTDKTTGNLWMFGGQGYDSTNNVVLLNDLWSYNTTTGQWTWVAGSNVGQQNGVYPAALGGTGTPGSRQTASLVADSLGNLWLFGGLGFDSIGTQNPGEIGGLPRGTAARRATQ